MIAANKTFLDSGKGYYMLKRQTTNATSAINISSITKAGKNEMKIALASAPSNWPTHVKIANATSNFNNGEYLVTYRDTTNNFLLIKNPNGVNQAGAAGTATPWGIADDSDYAAGTLVKNNLNEVIAIQYAVDGYFRFKMDNEQSHRVIEVVNLDASTAVTTATVKCSVLGTYFSDFPTAQASGSITAGQNFLFFIEHSVKGLWIEVFVDSNDSDYCVNLI
jgi:hypothetical protein